jgi:hypothetical protein
MALAKGTNSYVTLSEANAYLLDRLSAEVWLTTSDPDRERALITATSMLDDIEWLGYPVDDSQALAFPRVGTYYDTKLGRHADLPATVPVSITKACTELALHLLNNTATMNLTDSVSSLSVGNINLELIRPTSAFPFKIKSIFKHLLKNGTGKMWWRAN